MSACSAIIVDDEENAISLLKASLAELFPEVSVRHTCTDWITAFRLLQEQSFDLIFMDISMPVKSGMDLLRLLPGIKGEVIFVTAHEEHALEAFRFHAAGYLLKPVDDADLHAVVSRIISRQGIPSKSPVAETPGLLGIPGSKGIDYIQEQDIIYLQSEQKCTKVVLADRVLYSSYHLGRFRDFLRPELFFQVHRSYIINLSRVKQYLHDRGGIVMINNHDIPVARTIKDKLLAQFTTISRLSSGG